MKPYLLIAGDNYYPSSYTGDWIECYETEEEAAEKRTLCKNCLHYEKSFLRNIREFH